MAKLGGAKKGKVKKLKKLDSKWDEACEELAEWIRENLVTDLSWMDEV